MQHLKVKKLGPYELMEKVGGGRTSNVRRALRADVDGDFAVKVMQKAQFISFTLAKQFRKEVEILMKCDSCRILKLIDFIEDTANFYLITEFCEGGDLSHFIIQNRYLSDDFAKLIFRQVIEGLAYLESQGIAHRDVKPENLIIASDGQVRICDFGFAIDVCDPIPEFSGKCGTIGYVAPEIVSGQESSPFKSDVWSCGVLLFLMVTGRLPWPTSSHGETTAAICSGQYSIPHIVSPGCGRLIQRILQVDPAERPTYREILDDEWLRSVKVRTNLTKVAQLCFLDPAKVMQSLNRFVKALDPEIKKRMEEQAKAQAQSPKQPLKPSPKPSPKRRGAGPGVVRKSLMAGARRKSPIRGPQVKRPFR